MTKESKQLEPGITRIMVATNFKGEGPKQEIIVIDERPRWARIPQAKSDQDEEDREERDNNL